MHQIGEVAQELGLSLRTIRHYEQVGLVPPSGRTSGGFRLYTRQDIERLRLVRRMKPMEFTLEEMRDLLDLRERLANGTYDPDRTGMNERLEMYAEAAEARCAKLREQLEHAESVASMLRAEATRPAGATR